MIDYEKLKILYDLCEKYSLERGELGELCILINCLGEHKKRYYFNGIGFTTVDGLITKLTELTQAESRYKIGDEVWMVYDGEPRCFSVFKTLGLKYYLNGHPIGILIDESEND